LTVLTATDARAAGLVLILVDRADRRMLPALRLAATLVDYEARAVHVAVDADQTDRLTSDWLELGLTWVPLVIEEPAASLVETVREIVEREAEGRGRVLVVVPELDLGTWWQALLHRSTGRRIARGLSTMRRVSTVVVPCSL
jgi:hypothetical protein